MTSARMRGTSSAAVVVVVIGLWRGHGSAALHGPLGVRPVAE
jgi:hypothetical protein